jgi:hypothetical protein
VNVHFVSFESFCEVWCILRPIREARLLNSDWAEPEGSGPSNLEDSWWWWPLLTVADPLAPDPCDACVFLKRSAIAWNSEVRSLREEGGSDPTANAMSASVSAASIFLRFCPSLSELRCYFHNCLKSLHPETLGAPLAFWLLASLSQKKLQIMQVTLLRSQTPRNLCTTKTVCFSKERDADRKRDPTSNGEWRNLRHKSKNTAGCENLRLYYISFRTSIPFSVSRFADAYTPLRIRQQSTTLETTGTRPDSSPKKHRN